MSQLAIVIPAYKTKFLRATLQSIAAQTDRRFQVYVGDDASPEPVENIVREFSRVLPLHFHRFNDNLGKKSLVGHWTRCLKLSREPWLWIFSDDDLMEPGCVAAFYAELEKTAGQHDGYRFNTIVEKTSIRFPQGGSEAKPPHPRFECGVDFLCAQLRGPNNSNLQELIFSRTAWQRVGIPDFPLGWAADDAFMASLGEPLPLCAIAVPRIHWRWSDDNITGSSSRLLARKKLRAAAEFARWSYQFLTKHKMPAREAARLTENNYYFQLLQREMLVDRSILHETRQLAAQCWSRNTLSVVTKVTALNGKLLAKKILRRVRRKRG